MTPPPQPTSHQDNFPDSISITSATSTPRSNNHHHNDPRLHFMCSFGGKILPRPLDNQLRYVGGDTRIIAISRHITFSALLSKLSKTVGSVANNSLTVKYQLPNEDLDALISVSNDEDVENMMDEYDRVGSKTGRLRLFLFDELSRTSSISSILHGSLRRESWFLDALNGGGGSTGLERGASEASSIVSEIPDYLFGLDNSDDPIKIRTRSNLTDCVSCSDPGSPAPVISSSSSPAPSFTTSSAASITVIAPQMVQHLPMGRSRVETVMVNPPVSIPAGVVQGNNTMWQHNPDQIQTAVATSYQRMPVYYIAGPAQAGPMQAQFVQVQPGHHQQQIPVGYHPMGMGPGMSQIHGVPSGGMLRHMGVGLKSYDAPGQGYYTQPVHMYQAGMVPTALAGLDEPTVPGSDAMGSGDERVNI